MPKADEKTLITIGDENITRSKQLLLSIGFEEFDVDELINVLNTKYRTRELRKKNRERIAAQKAEKENKRKEAELKLATLPRVRLTKCECSHGNCNSMSITLLTNFPLPITSFTICDEYYNKFTTQIPHIKTEGATISEIWDFLIKDKYRHDYLPWQFINLLRSLDPADKEIVKIAYDINF